MINNLLQMNFDKFWFHYYDIDSLHPHIEGINDDEMEKNPAYVPIEMNQIEDKPTYVNL